MEGAMTRRRKIERALWWVPVLVMALLFIEPGYWVIHIGKADRIVYVIGFGVWWTVMTYWICQSRLYYGERWLFCLLTLHNDLL